MRFSVSNIVYNANKEDNMWPLGGGVGAGMSTPKMSNP